MRESILEYDVIRVTASFCIFCEDGGVENLEFRTLSVESRCVNPLSKILVEARKCKTNLDQRLVLKNR
jgi:hypothetical protein